MRLRALALTLALLLAPATLNAAPPRISPDEDPPRPPLFEPIHVIDNEGRIDINNLSMVVTNTGSFAFDKLTGSAGLEFPRGTGRTVMFAGGLWIGGLVNGHPRVTISEYSDEYGPGAVLGGVPDDPNRPEYRVYKLNRSYLTTTERDAALAIYNSGAVPFGAPPVAVQPDGTLGILGDQMLWAVYNDADPANHTNRAGSTAPLGVEVQQTTFAFNPPGPGPLSNTIFVRFKVINRGPNVLQDAHFGFWFDPDLGEFTDDVVGCVPYRSLGYCYNGDSSDGQYGSAPPAIGVSLLRGPELFPGGPRYGMRGFGSHVNGTDPSSALQSYHALRGLDPDGNLRIDPTNGIPTEYMFPGDPLTLSGWIDSQPADKRMLLGTGPVTIAPGQEQDLLIALIVGSADSRLHSLQQYLCDETALRAFAEAGFSGPYPGTTLCYVPEGPCERPADYWTRQCGPGAELDALQMQTIAQQVDERSVLFEWNQDPRASLCAELAQGDPLDVKAAAKREFVSLMATAAAADLGVAPPGGPGFRINLTRPVSCPSVPASNLGEVIQTAQVGANGSYLDLNPAHPVPIEGFDWGGSSFSGGVGKAVDLFGSTIVDPADFPEVEIRFDHSQPQYAYRYLRRELPGGVAPAVGRGYVYGGFHLVPFTCWDVTHNVQLDVLFLEKVVTDDNGNFLDPSFQHATFDSNWLPDASSDGNRETLWVIARPYTGLPDPEIVDFGNPLEGLLPASYVLWARRLSPAEVFDDGDRFRFQLEVVPAGADAALLVLAGQSVSDPAVRQAYADIAACLHALNENDGRGPGCEGELTPVVAHAGSDVTVECASSSGTAVQLDGSLSEGVSLTYAWSAPGISFDNPGAVRPTGSFPFGSTAVQLLVSSGGQTSANSVMVTIVDTTSPTLTVTLGPDELWPPNHKLVAIQAEVVAQDVCDGSPTIRLLSIASSEPDAGDDPDDEPDDVQGAEPGTADFDFRLRAERLGQAQGRGYQVCYEASDAGGNITVVCDTVTVPHDQSGHAALAANNGGTGLAIYGGWGAPVHSILATSVIVGTADFRRKSAGSGEPAYDDLDRDGNQDAVFTFSDGLPAVPAGESLFARWVAGGQRYLAELEPNPVTGVEGVGPPERLEAAIDANPVRGAARIRYALPRPGRVTVRVFDVAGHQVASLVDGWAAAGRHLAHFRPRASQLYLYRVEWEGTTLTGKFVALR